MKKELDYFKLGEGYGGNQDLFPDPDMKMGGCAAITACDSCIYFDLHKGTHLYPFNVHKLTEEDFFAFGMKMKPYLRPRWSGIDTLSLYMEGVEAYLSDQKCQDIKMEPLDGNEPVEKAEAALISQIDRDFPVPCLTLKHTDPAFEDFEWHWFLLTGYETIKDCCLAKAVTYGSCYWLDMERLWDTGYSRKGGLILYHG
ncbi:MAG TPA: hypothetical protein IAA06_08715 [Candidatus Blautia faecavium]|uniref:Uncharacterized protein n=1 Tax=Candidatus Blautia faecavium TaxID=2838487 RepID=A0A9D2RWL9_9FIRM|nr:hypothetical protein [Candidatus Blautia faecavium]